MAMLSPQVKMAIVPLLVVGTFCASVVLGSFSLTTKIVLLAFGLYVSAQKIQYHYNTGPCPSDKWAMQKCTMELDFPLKVETRDGDIFKLRVPLASSLPELTAIFLENRIIEPDVIIAASRCLKYQDEDGDSVLVHSCFAWEDAKKSYIKSRGIIKRKPMRMKLDMPTFKPTTEECVMDEVVDIVEGHGAMPSTLPLLGSRQVQHSSVDRRPSMVPGIAGPGQGVGAHIHPAAAAPSNCSPITQLKAPAENQVGGLRFRNMEDTEACSPCASVPPPSNQRLPQYQQQQLPLQIQMVSPRGIYTGPTATTYNSSMGGGVTPDSVRPQVLGGCRVERMPSTGSNATPPTTAKIPGGFAAMTPTPLSGSGSSSYGLASGSGGHGNYDSIVYKTPGVLPGYKNNHDSIDFDSIILPSDEVVDIQQDIENQEGLYYTVDKTPGAVPGYHGRGDAYSTVGGSWDDSVPVAMQGDPVPLHPVQRQQQCQYQPQMETHSTLAGVVSSGTETATTPQGSREVRGSKGEKLLQKQCLPPTSTPQKVKPVAAGITTEGVDSGKADGYYHAIMQDGSVRSHPWSHGLGEIDVLGRGAFGTVSKVMDTSTGATLAMKEIIFGTERETKSRLAALTKELEILQRLYHPHIVRYVGRETLSCPKGGGEEILRLFLELASGGSLQKVLAKHGSLSPNLVAKYSYEMFLGLQYLHAQGVVHSDIKSGNLLLSSEGRLQLSDFGGSRVVQLKSTSLSQKSAHASAGTPHWMSPEVVVGDSPPTMYSDIWSFGATVIEMMTGAPPFSVRENNGTFAVVFMLGDLRKKHMSNPRSENSFPPIPVTNNEDLNSFLRATLHVDPRQRATMAELVNHPFLLHGKALYDQQHTGTPMGAMSSTPTSGFGGVRPRTISVDSLGSARAVVTRATSGSVSVASPRTSTEVPINENVKDSVSFDAAVKAVLSHTGVPGSEFGTHGLVCPVEQTEPSTPFSTTTRLATFDKPFHGQECRER